MNKLEKFFNTLSSPNPKLLKKYTTHELTSQIKEYVDFTPYIVKNIYKLLISQNSDDRNNGAEILKSLMFQFKLVTDFKIEYVEKKEEYLGSTGEEFVEKKLSVSEQKKVFKELAGLEHLESNLVTEIDFKSNSNICIKKIKIQDKPIMNVIDFFENLSNNLLNYEWNKRHGAFLAYCAIFESETNGQIEIKIDSTLFLKIYEILKSDKFTDFIEDRATAPVREAAASLLSGIFPRISKNNIIEELIKFLDDDDWQTQYSGLLALTSLKSFIIKKKELCNKLQNLLLCRDEDVKFLAAEILLHFYEECDEKIIFDRCLQNIQDDEEISISKVSIISLLAKCKYKITDVSMLYNYFTSPIPDIRKSVLKLAESINNEALDFLYAELILIDEKDAIRNEAIEILKKKKLTSDFLIHFLKIIGTSLYDPYNKNEFVSYDDLYFTKSGVKALGKNTILNNRVELFKLILENEYTEALQLNLSTLIGDVFIKFFTKIKYINEPGVKRTKINEKDIKLLHEKFTDLKILPLKELENKLANPKKLLLHPLGESIYVDYIRWQISNDYNFITDNMINFFRYETSNKFLEFIVNLLTSDYDKKAIELDFFISEAYKNFLLGYENFLVFFKEFGIRIFSDKFYKVILRDKNRYKFFAKTITFYKDFLYDLKFLYEEAFIDGYVEILKGFIISIQFSEDFISKMLQKMNLDILEPLISFIDHSFYPVLVKPLLSLTSCIKKQEQASKLFSYIIPRLNFRMKSGISNFWINKIKEAKKDLECLLDNSKIKNYSIKCPSRVTLRKYQSDGVKWINFLYTFNLNGILADDMGLGKTIQVLSFICSEIYQTNKKALVICPSSLIGHWKTEIENFFPNTKPSCYKKKQIQDFNILIVSYDSFRNDFMEFINEDWFYVILDEGHILRNSNTMLYQRISKFKCRQRLILTGTPVHNSVEDLVSLFNLLMPNYLGTVKEIPFMSSKMSDQEINAIHLKLENLNKQILPFILRRLKVDVLTDLPPKIIRDITVDMGPEQRNIYISVEEKGDINTETVNYKSIQNKMDGLKRTRDLLNASSHISYFKSSTELSCKMRGLEDIINLYGGEDIRNKILVFFQYKTTIDYVIQDFKKKFNLKFLRLDGSIPSSKRAKIASDFNSGNIPILFLTTLVGGLGLNLTGADTVIFYEHDWNPFNDLQAMDRAHRIGQKNTVNVFRLIAKESIEEKVMDLQSFKVFIASSIVTQQNADIETMNTKDLLERFRN